MSISYFHWALHPWAIYAIVGLALAYFTLPQGHAEPDQLGVLAAARRPRRRPDREVDRHPRDLRHAVRQRDLARPRRAADQQRARLPVGRRADRRRRRPDHRRADRGVRAVGRLRRRRRASSGSATATWCSRSCCWCSSSWSGRRCSLRDAHRVGRRLPDSIVPRSFRTGAFGDSEWLVSWTIFYWAWWISWAPFVGTFIARISRGRTCASSCSACC